MQFLRLYNYPVLQQLQLEEALLRADQNDWCIINQGAPRAIVMGISGKPEQHVNAEKMEADPVPLIRRFSGGGTVIIDEETLFITFIGNAASMQVAACPQKVMQWSGEFYQSVFALDQFALRENDYVLGEKKCGGNAQYFCKERWLHHTSFLWNFDPQNMDYLTLPPKMPKYRQARHHCDFLCSLNAVIPSMEHLIARVTEQLDQNFGLNQVALEEAIKICARPHRQATVLVNEKALCDGF